MQLLRMDLPFLFSSDISSFFIYCCTIEHFSGTTILPSDYHSSRFSLPFTAALVQFWFYTCILVVWSIWSKTYVPDFAHYYVCLTLLRKMQPFACTICVPRPNESHFRSLQCVEHMYGKFCFLEYLAVHSRRHFRNPFSVEVQQIVTIVKSCEQHKVG